MAFLSNLRLSEIVPANWLRVFGIRFDKSPIRTVDGLVDFIQTRAAYVAQTALYGYLKTRMGTRYREVFQDETFVPAINQAKWRSYGACLSDLAVFAAALAGGERRLESREMAALARHCFKTAVERTFDDGDAERLRAPLVENFARRTGEVIWPNAAQGEHAFTTSPREVVDAAPIADELKQYDAEIVINSVRFRWRDVREQLRKRLDGEAVCADWRGAGR